MNLGFPEMLFIFLLALLLFGPRKLPEIGRQIGKAMAEFKRASNEFKSQIETEIRQLELEENSKQTIAPPPAPEGAIATTLAAPAAAAAAAGDTALTTAPAEPNPEETPSKGTNA